MPVINCAVSGLETYSPTEAKPWDLQRAMHLARRTILGANFDEIKNAVLSNPIDIVDQIIDAAISKPLSAAPEWGYWDLSDYENLDAQYVDQIIEFATKWLHDCKSKNLRDHLTLFWHNHFVARQDVYQCPSYMYQYQSCLEKFAIGNFKEFVREIGLTPAMLAFLNGAQNTRFEPNENYARELFELFTLGVDNGYTQQDIEETARALTGYNALESEYCGPIVFNQATFDPGEKNIFGQTGNWGYDDVIDILFQEKGDLIAKYICGKLYTYFVNPDPSEEIIEQMASIMMDHDFELAPVFRTLFKSEHFFEVANIGTFIPGHLEIFITTSNEFDCPLNDEEMLQLGGYASDFGQAILNPVDVAGWPGNRAWITTNHLTARWNFLTYLMFLKFENNPEVLRSFAVDLTDNSKDPKYISQMFLDYFLPKGVQFENDLETAVGYLKSEIPENYFQDGSWSLQWDTAPAQLTYLMFYIVNLPEFQLK